MKEINGRKVITWKTKMGDSENPLESPLYGFVQLFVWAFLLSEIGFSRFGLRRVCFLLQVPVLMPMDLMVEASPRRIFANAHTYHINSISVNSDHETYLSADDLRINLWHLEITDRSFSILFFIICKTKSSRSGSSRFSYCCRGWEVVP